MTTVTTEMLDQLARLTCPRCKEGVQVRADRPLAGAEEMYLLEVRCRCGFQASVEAADPAEACHRFLRLAQAHTVRTTSPARNAVRVLPSPAYQGTF